MPITMTKLLDQKPESRTWAPWAAVAALIITLAGVLLAGGTERGDIRARVTRSEQDIQELRRVQEAQSHEVQLLRGDLKTVISEQRILHGQDPNVPVRAKQ